MDQFQLECYEKHLIEDKMSIYIMVLSGIVVWILTKSAFFCKNNTETE